MFPPLPPLPPLQSWLSGTSPVLLAILGAGFFLFLSYSGKDHFYWALNWLLETHVPFFRALGELLSWVDSFVKACGVNLFLSIIGVSVMPTTLGSLVVLTLILFFVRHWIYPSAFKAVTTVSRTDDVSFVQDIAFRTVGIYQLLFWGLVGYRLF